jgi:arylsulfatase A-like enzyme/Tfp pilus assembly protein PilF
MHRLMSCFVPQRRIVLPVMLMLGALASAVATFRFSAPTRLNVVLITLDTTRADHLGVYGYPDGLTDAIDQLGLRGVVFEQAYATVPLTLPSHTSMLTGLYPPEHGLRVNGTGCLSAQIPLLPEILKKHRYHTGAFLAAFVLDSKFGLSRGFDFYDDDLSGTKPAAHAAERRREGPSVVDAALEWLKKRKSEPFFCWIHLYDAHDEYDARPELFGQRFTKQPYDAGIAVESRQVGRVVEFLKSQALEDRTLIIVAGDHGEGLGDHDEDEHGMLVYNSTLHVPLLLSGPASVCRSGHRVASAVSLVDLTPTLLDILQIPSPKHVSGRSLRSVLLGESISPRPCYAETQAPLLDNRWCPQQAVITEKWKLVHTARPELFDLEIDPQEKANVIETSEDVRKELQNLLETMQAEFVLTEADNLRLSDNDIAKLSALGYVTAGMGSGRPQVPDDEPLADVKDMLPHLKRFSLARNLAADGQLDEAIAVTLEILAETNHYPNARIFLGDLYRQRGNLDDAAAAYREVLVRQPDSSKAHAHLALVYILQEKYEQAIAEYRDVIKQDSEAAQAHYDLAQIFKRLKKFDTSIGEFREAIRSDPGFVAAHFQLGLLLAHLNRPADAAASFEQALRYDAGFAMAHTNLASVRQQLCDNDRAPAQQAVKLEPALFEARFNLGVILAGGKQYKAAIAEFNEAQKIRPDDPRPSLRIREAELALSRVGN